MNFITKQGPIKKLPCIMGATTALEQIEAKAGAGPGFLERGFISIKV